MKANYRNHLLRFVDHDMDMQLRLELVQQYYINGRSPVRALRAYKTAHGIVDDPCTPQAVTKLIHKFETEFTLHDKPKSGRSSTEQDRRETVEDSLKNTVNEKGATSIRIIANHSGIPRSSVHRILRQEMKLYPYRLQLYQEIHESDKLQRLNFATWLRNNEEKVPFILWSDEAYLHLNGDVSRYHCRIWSSQKPTNCLKKSLHPLKVCVWFAFTCSFKLTPFIFDETITAEKYLSMLKDHVKPQLAQRRKLSQTIFMQDGAPPHFANIVRNYLYQTFSSDRVISRGCEIVWPSRSPDLNPLDYWFWGTLKARVFHRNAPTTLEDLKHRIVEECAQFTSEEMSTAVSSLWRRCALLEEVGGGHFQQFL